jgi:hypothetical protein
MLMPIVIILSVFYADCHKQVNYAECHNAECHNAECHKAECHNAECHNAECRCAECRGATKMNLKAFSSQLHLFCIRNVVHWTLTLLDK